MLFFFFFFKLKGLALISTLIQAGRQIYTHREAMRYMLGR